MLVRQCLEVRCLGFWSGWTDTCRASGELRRSWGLTWGTLLELPISEWPGQMT